MPQPQANEIGPKVREVVLTPFGTARKAFIKFIITNPSKGIPEERHTFMSESIIEGYRLSPQQQRLWTLQQADAAAPYSAQCVAWLKGPLDAVRLQRVVADVVERYEILRTTVELLPGTTSPVQIIGEAHVIWNEPCDLRELDHLQQEKEIEALSLLERDIQDGEAKGQVRVTLAQLDTDVHALMLSFSAMSIDRAGMKEVVRELSRQYGSSIDEEPLQYADLSEWQNELLESVEMESGRQHWQRRELPLPLDVKFPLESRRRGKTQSFSPRTYNVALDARTETLIASLTASRKVSAAAFWLSCWQTLVWRLTGQAELVTGMAFEGRSHGGLENAVGLLTKYLPLHAQLSQGMRFDDLLLESEWQVREAAEWQEYFSWDHTANGNTPNYYAVCFDFDTAAEEYAAAGLRFSLWREYVYSERFKLKLSIHRSHCTIHYDASLFEAVDIQSLATQLLRVVESAIASPGAAIDRLELLSDAERNSIVEDYNVTFQAYENLECIHTAIEAQARRRPEATAVTDDEAQMSYGELNARANQIAHLLQELGVGPEVRVGVLMERSVTMIAALLGILKAGGAYVPIDPEYPPQRIAYMLENASVEVLVTQTALLDSLPAHSAQTFNLDTQAEEIAKQSEENIDSGVQTGNLAYVIYTSGSTGQPKGVGVTHHNTSRLFAATQASFNFDENDVWTFFHSYAFDFSVWEIWGALVHGGKLVVVPYWISRAPDDFYRLLCTEKVTVLNQTPSSFRQLIPVEEAAELYGDLALRLVIFGGEALEFQSLRPWFDRHGDQEPQLVNMYGITETTVHVTYFSLSIADLYKNSGSIIGSPIPDLRLYVLDNYMRPVPLGVTGELYVGGAGLARGYLNQPALTAERFIADPFGKNAGDRMYRTGDLARNQRGGTLEYLGRADQQVKIRGFRIELGEIETALCRDTLIKEAVVVVIDDESGDKRLVAYVAGEHLPGLGQLRQHLAEQLPDYMIPSQFVTLDKLPLTPNGKIDRRALPAPERGTESVETYVAARTPVEEMMAGIWGEVLGIERVGVTDNFFELGGHSLLATQIISRAREAFGVELQLRTLFESPTVTALADSVEVILKSEAGSALTVPPIRVTARSGALPLSFSQERLWFLQQLEPQSAFYNVPVAVRLHGALDVGALERTFTEMVRRHEVLRTTFSIADEQPVQLIHEPGPLALPVEDLSALPLEEREREARRLSAAQAQAPFSLATGPLLRVSLLRLGAEEHVLVAVMHHIVSDGWSRGVLIREMMALYEAYRQGQESPLAELPIQYADYAVWQREWLQGAALEEQLSYWREQLAGAPPLLLLPTEKVRPPVQRYAGESLPFSLSEELSQQLTELSRKEGVTLFMTLLAAFQTLLWRYSSEPDVVVGTTIAGRGRRETEELIGFFVNTLVVRTQLNVKEDFRGALRRVREVMLGAYAHQDVPFERLVEELQPARSLSYSPLFQILFSLNSTERGALKLGDVQLEALRSEHRTAKFDLTLSMEAAGARLVGTLIYNTDLYTAERIEKVAQHYERILGEVVSDPGQRIAEIGVLDEVERQLVEEWNVSRALSAPIASRPTVDFVAASTPLETMVAEVWREVLGVDQVGVHHNFFDLGGRSLLVVQVHGKLTRMLEQDFPLVDLFKYPTVHSLAEYLTAGTAGESSVEQGTGRAETRKSMRRRQNLRQPR